MTTPAVRLIEPIHQRASKALAQIMEETALAQKCGSSLAVAVERLRLPLYDGTCCKTIVTNEHVVNNRQAAQNFHVWSWDVYPLAVHVG